MKRLMVIAMVALFGFAFGCGGSKAPAVEEAPNPDEIVEDALGTEEPAPEEDLGAEPAEGDAPMEGEAPAEDEAPVE